MEEGLFYFTKADSTFAGPGWPPAEGWSDEAGCRVEGALVK